jgi:ABC-2 type transport system ATP-binding protein
MNRDVVIHISGARKVYRRALGRSHKTVVDGLDLDVAKGTIHGLLGPNGAGKTTTLKMLLGLVRADDGEFQILGKDSRSRAGREAVGFLPEQPYFPSHLRAESALRFYGRLAGVSATTLRERVPELLGLVGLSPHADVMLHKYSRGMLQRFGIAQALVGRPEVAVLDEPASGLDPIGQRGMRNLMLELKDRGVSILLSSHQLSEVETVCDRVTIINEGRVSTEGDIHDLLNVAGRTSIRVRGLPDGIPDLVAGLVDDVTASGGEWFFSVADDDVRRVLDGVEQSGGRLVALNPKRESLEDYFASMFTGEAQAGDGPDAR